MGWVWRIEQLRIRRGLIANDECGKGSGGKSGSTRADMTLLKGRVWLPVCLEGIYCSGDAALSSGNMLMHAQADYRAG